MGGGLPGAAGGGGDGRGGPGRHPARRAALGRARQRLDRARLAGARARGCSTSQDPASRRGTGSWRGSPATGRTRWRSSTVRRRALAVATRFGDVGLHTRALGDLGYALVSQGRLAAGFARLDEALAALSSGEVQDPFAVSTTCCALLSACDRAGDADRAAEWLRFVRETVLAPAGGRPRMLGAHCQVALGGVLCAGRRMVPGRGGGALGARAAAAARSRPSGSRRRPGWRTCTSSGAGSRRRRSCSPRSRTSPRRRPRWRVCTWRARSRTSRSRSSSGRAPCSAGTPCDGPTCCVLTVRAALASGAPDAAEQAAAQLRLLADAGDAPLVRACADLAEGLLPGGDREHRAGGRPAGRGPPGLHACAGARCSPRRPGSLWPRSRRRTPTPSPPLARRTRSPSGWTPPVLRDRAAAVLRAHGASAPRPAAGTQDAAGAQRAGGRDPRRACGAVTPTARSPRGCSSPPRRSSTTSAGCSPSSASAPAPRPPPSPRRPSRGPEALLTSAGPSCRRRRIASSAS